VVQEADREADLSAQHPTARQAARVPAPDVDARRQGGAAVATTQGPPAAVGLIWRVRDRQTFAGLRSSRVRVRGELVTLTHVADERRAPARVAFAIGRRTGSAVTRNRIRRRLRMIFADAAGAAELPPGAYLVGVRHGAASASFAQLQTDVTTVLSKLVLTDRSIGAT
jgi:ribonuclease P protein component